MKARGNPLTKLFAIGLLFAFLSLSVFLILLSSNLKKANKNINSEVLIPNISITPVAGQTEGAPRWETYTNPAYKYSISYPGLLIKHRIETKGEYLSFVRFEENRYSGGQKGVAIGVSDKGIGEEAVKIKKEVVNGGIGELVSEKEVIVLGQEAVRLDFEPKTEGTGENRTVYIINRNGQSFSVSTVPDQIEQVVNSLKFF